MRDFNYHIIFLILAIVAFLIPPLMYVLADQAPTVKTVVICFGLGSAFFAAAHLP